MSDSRRKFLKAAGLGSLAFFFLSSCQKLAYDIALNKGVTISPFVQVSFAPYYYSPGAEKCLNLTQGLMEESRNNSLNIQAGLRFSCIK